MQMALSRNGYVVGWDPLCFEVLWGPGRARLINNLQENATGKDYGHGKNFQNDSDDGASDLVSLGGRSESCVACRRWGAYWLQES